MNFTPFLENVLQQTLGHLRFNCHHFTEGNSIAFLSRNMNSKHLMSPSFDQFLTAQKQNNVAIIQEMDKS